MRRFSLLGDYMPGNFVGSKWWKVDFHAHSAASTTDAFRNADALSDRDWLLAQMAAGIDAVVVTDHNSGGQIDALKTELAALQQERPDGYRALVLFPGVEISTPGPVHVLAVLDPSKATSDVDHLLGAVRYGGTKGDSDAVTELATSAVIKMIIENQGIAIPAHYDQAKGLGKQEGQTLGQVLETDGLLALEVVGATFQPAGMLMQSRKSFSFVVGSDCHKREDIGGRYTWVKMTEPNLEGLRFALLDGERSVIRFDKVAGDLNDQHAQI